MKTILGAVKWILFRPPTRHSIVLSGAGVIYILLGMSMQAPNVEDGPQYEGLILAREIAPLYVWGYIFILSGLLALVSARYPPIHSPWGYMVLTGLSASWGTFYLLGVIFRDTPSPYLSITLLWVLVAFLWWAISGLKNPDGTGAIE